MIWVIDNHGYLLSNRAQALGNKNSYREEKIDSEITILQKKQTARVIHENRTLKAAELLSHKEQWGKITILFIVSP